MALPQGSAKQKNVLTVYNFTRSITKKRAQPVAQAPFLTPSYPQTKISEARKQDFSQQQLRKAAGELRHPLPVFPASTRRAGPGGTQPECRQMCVFVSRGSHEEENDQARVDEGREQLREGKDSRDRQKRAVYRAGLYRDVCRSRAGSWGGKQKRRTRSETTRKGMSQLKTQT